MRPEQNIFWHGPSQNWTSFSRAGDTVVPSVFANYGIHSEDTAAFILCVIWDAGLSWES